jgi:ribose 5-phosphate isomerase A
MILDCRFTAIPDPLAIGMAIKVIPGVVEHGLFIGMASIVLIAGARGVATMIRPDA